MKSWQKWKIYMLKKKEHTYIKRLCQSKNSKWFLFSKMFLPVQISIMYSFSLTHTRTLCGLKLKQLPQVQLEHWRSTPAILMWDASTCRTFLLKKSEAAAFTTSSSARTTGRLCRRSHELKQLRNIQTHCRFVKAVSLSKLLSYFKVF